MHRAAPLLVVCLAFAASACLSTDGPEAGAEPAAGTASGAREAAPSPASTTSTSAGTTEPQPTEPQSSAAPGPTIAGGVGLESLATAPDGAVIVQDTPAILRDRQLPTVDTLPPPIDDAFDSTISPFDGEPLRRSTWAEGCPVAPEQLRYVTVSFFGFDGEFHTGELVVAADQAESVVEVFRVLHEARFPIEEMRLVTFEDLEATQTGDSNNTASFVCRAVTGGTRFSEHAYGLAIDVNPFHNPYERGDVVLPELASSYLDRSGDLVGMIGPDSLVVRAFAEIGWEWGGNWNSLVDYQHFALNNR
jgi:hypothetical protein